MRHDRPQRVPDQNRWRRWMGCSLSSATSGCTSRASCAATGLEACRRRSWPQATVQTSVVHLVRNSLPQASNTAPTVGRHPHQPSGPILPRRDGRRRRDSSAIQTPATRTSPRLSLSSPWSDQRLLHSGRPDAQDFPNRTLIREVHARTTSIHSLRGRQGGAASEASVITGRW